jgi:hypothetical protein
MADYFFYGSLMDADVLSAVLGKRVPPTRFRPARLVGHRCLCNRRDEFPVIVADPGTDVAGVLVRGIGAAAARRLARYEGPGYALAKRSVATATGRIDAHVFVPVRPGISIGKAWNFQAWRRRHKRRLLRALKPTEG